MSIVTQTETLNLEPRLEGMGNVAIDTLVTAGLPEGISIDDLEEAFNYLDAIELAHDEDVEHAHSEQAREENSEESLKKLQTGFADHAPVINFVREELKEGNPEIVLILSGLARKWREGSDAPTEDILTYPRKDAAEKWDPGHVDRLSAAFMPVASALFRKHNRNNDVSAESFDQFLDEEKPDFATFFADEEEQVAANTVYDYLCAIELAHAANRDKWRSLDPAKDRGKARTINDLRNAVKAGNTDVISTLLSSATYWQNFTSHPRTTQERWSMNRDDMYDEFWGMLYHIGPMSTDTAK